MEGSITLFAHESGLHLFLALQMALFAVSPAGLAVFVLRCSHNPVVQPIVPCPGQAGFLWATGNRGLAVVLQHDDDQLPEELQEGVLPPGDLHAEPPGIHCTDTQGPGVKWKPPFLDAHTHPVEKKLCYVGQ